MENEMTQGLTSYVPVTVPSNQTFLTQWHAWIHGKVSRHFKRDKERILDTAQNVRLRLISKDFIGRWFFKHLREELVDRSQAEVILGGKSSIVFIGTLQPENIINWSCIKSKLNAFGLEENEVDKICSQLNQTKDLKQVSSLLKPDDFRKFSADRCVRNLLKGNGCIRSCSHSLWKINSLLAHARFDYERYYYSIQNHTIDSDRVLRLLGYEAGKYTILQSMQRQGRLLPAELTEHDCKRKGLTGVAPSVCPGCEHGISLLRARGLSLADDWTKPEIAEQAAKLRWNDSQLDGFLRDWQKSNTVFASPQYIMRTSMKPGVNAGLLKYAEMVVDHEVYNDFKRMARSDDLSCSVLNKSMSPEYSDTESVAWEGGDGEETKGDRIIRDVYSMSKFEDFEDAHDIAKLLESSKLTDEELNAIQHVDLGEMTVREYSEKVERPIPRIHRVRGIAMAKLRESRTSE